MGESKEPETIIKKLPQRDFWKRNRVVGHTTVASGPLPTQEELPPQKPPEVIKEEIKDAQIDDWHRRTDN